MASSKMEQIVLFFGACLTPGSDNFIDVCKILGL